MDPIKKVDKIRIRNVHSLNSDLYLKIRTASYRNTHSVPKLPHSQTAERNTVLCHADTG